VAQYAAMINAFAPRLREFDPGIKLVANWHATFRKHGEQYDELFALAGEHIDVVDVHWYNMWGTASWDQWQAVTPNGVFTGDSYLSEIGRFREIAARNGYPDVKLASLEWNVGPRKNNAGPKPNPAQSALIQSEMMLQFMLGGLDMATFWPLFWESEFGFRSFFDKDTGAPRPNAGVFEQFGHYQGTELLECTPSSVPSKMLYLAARSDATGEIRVCVLNKNGHAVELTLEDLPSKAVGSYRAFALSGDLAELRRSRGEVDGGKTVVEPYSITFISYHK
jgi:hypothetical protein